MKVITLKPIVKNNRISFSISKKSNDNTRFDQLENINEDYKKLNIERYLLRKSTQSKKLVVGKRF